MSTVTSLATTKPQFSLSPQNLQEAMQFADMLSKSNLVPKDYQGNPANCIIAMQWGMEIGLQPLQAMQSIAVINGRPSVWGDAMLAIVRGSGLLEYITEEPTDTGCTCKLKRKGEAEVVRVFTMEDAKRAGLAGKQGPWQQSPKRMMQMRARAFALRDVFTDVLRGVHIAEISQDEPAERDMGRAEELPTPSTAPKTRAEKARAALADKRSEAVTVPSIALADVLQAIEAARDEDSMAHAKALGAQMQDGPEKEQAIAAYKRQVAALKAQAEQQTVADPQTGEILDHAQHEFAGPTFADAHAAVRGGDLDMARDIARSLSEGERQQIEAAIANLQGDQQQAETQQSSRRGRGQMALD